MHACFVSGGCRLYVVCGDTMLFVYVAFMGGFSPVLLGISSGYSE